MHLNPKISAFVVITVPYLHFSYHFLPRRESANVLFATWYIVLITRQTHRHAYTIPVIVWVRQTHWHATMIPVIVWVRQTHRRAIILLWVRDTVRQKTHRHATMITVIVWVEHWLITKRSHTTHDGWWWSGWMQSSCKILDWLITSRSNTIAYDAWWVVVFWMPWMDAIIL